METHSAVATGEPQKVSWREFIDTHKELKEALIEVVKEELNDNTNDQP